MRFFWIAILLLCVLAAGAYALRTRTPIVDPIAAAPSTPAAAPAHDIPAATPAVPTTPIATTPDPTPATTPIADHPAPDPKLVPPSPNVPVEHAKPDTTTSNTAPTPAHEAPAPAATSAPVTPAAPAISPAQPSPAPPATAHTSTTSESTKPAAPSSEPTKTDAPKPTAANPQTKPEPPKSEPVKPEASKAAPAPSDSDNELAKGLANLVGDDSMKSAEGGAPAISAPPPAEPASPKPAAASAAKVALEPQPDGTTLVDGKYLMKGKGTRDDPYRITWEQLVSAEEVYQPRLGRKQIPERVKMLDGKYVRVSGYIAFPLMAQSADEMLMMLNQWDGCCIGVPPTPYDAIEVKLKTPAKGDARLRTSGTLTGVLRVDPYLVKDWLVSLYVMDDGVVSDAVGTAAPGQHAK